MGMASIERTAYPQFKRNPVVRELVATYTPTDQEMDFIVKHARQPGHRLTLALLLKSFQRLKYFPTLEDIPAHVTRHVRQAMQFRVKVKPAELKKNTPYRYRQWIRTYLQVRAYGEGGLDVAARAVLDAATVMDNPPDLI